MIEPGTILENRYLIQKRVGEGGMGTVYLASDQRFNSPVAIKETLFNDPDLQRAFEREAQLLNSLRHPALPHVSDHFIDGNGQFIVMEYISGEDLSEMLKRQTTFEVSKVLHWADQLLDALEYLHAQNPPVIHRDIKPQNLKLTPRGEIILLDFGLAKGKPGDTSRLTVAKSIFGYSRSYSPLEQIQGTGTDPRSDLYSLAATIYHLLTGKSPVDALTRATKVLNGESDPLLPISVANTEVSADVAQVLEQALALNANVRPASAAVMRRELNEATTKTSANSNQASAAALQNAIVDSTILRQQFGTDINDNQQNLTSFSISLSDDVEATKISEIDQKDSLTQYLPADKPFFENLPRKTAAGLPVNDKADNSSANNNIMAEAAPAVPSATNLSLRKRQSSWIKPASIAAALILGGGSLATWYASTANNLSQNNNQAVSTANVSSEKNLETTNANNKSISIAPANVSAQRSLPTPAASVASKTANSAVKSMINSSNENEENRKTAPNENDTPRNVVVVKSAPQTHNGSAKNERETKNAGDQEEDAPSSADDGDKSSIEIRDLRNLPAEERDRIIDDLKRRQTQPDRRNEKLERRQQRNRERRNKQKLPALLGAPPAEDQ